MHLGIPFFNLENIRLIFIQPLLWCAGVASVINLGTKISGLALKIFGLSLINQTIPTLCTYFLSPCSRNHFVMVKHAYTHYTSFLSSVKKNLEQNLRMAFLSGLSIHDIKDEEDDPSHQLPPVSAINPMFASHSPLSKTSSHPIHPFSHSGALAPPREEARGRSLPRNAEAPPTSFPSPIPHFKKFTEPKATKSIFYDDTLTSPFHKSVNNVKTHTRSVSHGGVHFRQEDSQFKYMSAVFCHPLIII